MVNWCRIMKGVVGGINKVGVKASMSKWNMEV